MESAVKCCVHRAMKELCYDMYGKAAMESKDLKVGGICQNYAGKPKDADECPKPPSNPSLTAQGSVKVPEPVKALEEEPTAPQGDSTTKATEVPPPPPVGGLTVKADDVPVPQPEEDSVSMKPKNDSKEGGTVTTAGTKQEEASNGQAESTTSTPSAASDNNDNNEMDKDTGADIPNNAPESDVEGTEGKQDEIKYNNPKETLVQVADIKNVTATSGDSDSSTAVYHSTSPLLLLLVACAAAVVVAA
ncbi:mucin-associated surface protein (MASP), putative [Trypanosoma cruzi marinkellei]|uniref:Mucin-associated surface protein (MASP), putative n=1 Tax=Trypanosoma cruzi marinkellei TaxID=85056 RepID=K2MNN4_TRYCR|nr:mucin-associated surface protein (MASP), putative [Trypanosoma cruzi marinkellei]